jgi:hypothetical protein
MIPMLADGGTPRDQIITLLYIGAVVFGWVAYSRLRGRGFPRLPRFMGWLSGGAAAASLVLAIVLPPIISPEISSARPSSSARVTIVSPRPGQEFRGDPAEVPVTLRLTGGRIVRFTSTKLVSNEGHIHLYLDGALILMSYSLNGRVGILPGAHALRAEYVAVDHAPFNPPVLARVRFRVVA